MTFFITLIYMILGATARRIFGGACENIPILKNRGVQTAFMLILFMSIYVTNPYNWQCWLLAGAVSCWLQFQFWSRGHGVCFDIGRSGQPSADALIRYNERWYHIPCDWLFEKVFKQADNKYGFLYDFLYMGLRYTCPMIPLAFIDWGFLLIGLAVSPIYAFCWTLYERETWIRPKQNWLNAPTKWAELVVGGVVYAGAYLIWR